MKSRQIALGLALAVTVVATVWSLRDPADQPQVVQPIERPRLAVSQTTSIASATPGSLIALLPREPEKIERDAFRSRSWVPPAPIVVAAKAEPPPVITPTAPPIPFRFIGIYEADGAQSVFLSQGDESLVVKAGDTLAGSWKVESVESTRMVFVYLPTNEKQNLEWGTANR